MKKLKVLVCCLLLVTALSNCSKDKAEPIDTTYPEINTDMAQAFPKQCSVLKRGEKFVFKVLITDNAQLGSLSVDIHHNFDHHTHSTELEECEMAPIKQAVKPFLLIKNIAIPAGLKSYEVNAEIEVPADVDPGDYHFMIRLTDKEGWQTIKGLSIKIN
ncbi:DUF4625 domain-containing protein [Pedobacter gandavensis]|uniref:DUF4625 domain-containing protein n=1 Tax=Pedobacter TaxID=84567 RepID=UPI001C99EDB2|nr:MULTISPECIES: DUF4625 domain-containing protein [Pedobacter]WGQ10894.1 DUF4625 domain-containing protein [Pedobacter gandavensis]